MIEDDDIIENIQETEPSDNLEKNMTIAQFEDIDSKIVGLNRLISLAWQKIDKLEKKVEEYLEPYQI